VLERRERRGEIEQRRGKWVEGELLLVWVCLRGRE
jgi:hypothetical protein